MRAAAVAERLSLVCAECRTNSKLFALLFITFNNFSILLSLSKSVDEMTPCPCTSIS